MKEQHLDIDETRMSPRKRSISPQSEASQQSVRTAVGFPQRQYGHPSSSESLEHKFCGNGDFEKPRPGDEGIKEDHLEVLLSSLLCIHCIQDGLPLGGVALPELLNLPLHHGIQGTQAHLQLLKVQVLQLGDSVQIQTQTNDEGKEMSHIQGSCPQESIFALAVSILTVLNIPSAKTPSVYSFFSLLHFQLKTVHLLEQSGTHQFQFSLTDQSKSPTMAEEKRFLAVIEN